MKLYQIEQNGEHLIAVEVDRGMVNFTRAFQNYNFLKRNRYAVHIATISELLQYPDFSDELILRVLDYLEAHNLWEHFLLKGDYRIRAPILQPGKIIAIGLNYRAHAAESGRAAPEEPIYFGKVGSIVIGPDDFIRIPPDVGRVDHELELGVIVGKKANKISEEDWEQYVAGYTVFNDVTARALQRQDKAAQNPWFRSKNMDTFAPMGPCLVTRREIPDPQNLKMELRVNGIVKQQDSTGNMIFPIPRLLAYITRYLTLLPGDVIATGTPEGVGELHEGNVVEAEIERIGVLRNTVALAK